MVKVRAGAGGGSVARLKAGSAARVRTAWAGEFLRLSKVLGQPPTSRTWPGAPGRALCLSIPAP